MSTGSRGLTKGPRVLFRPPVPVSLKGLLYENADDLQLYPRRRINPVQHLHLQRHQHRVKGLNYQVSLLKLDDTCIPCVYYSSISADPQIASLLLAPPGRLLACFQCALNAWRVYAIYTIDFDALARHQRIDVFRDASSIILYRIPSISLH